MNCFKSLQEACKQFENELRSDIEDIQTARREEAMEEVVCKKMKDIALYSSKLLLMRAKRIAETKIAEQEEKKPMETIVAELKEVQSNKILDSQLLKSTTHAFVIKKLLQAEDSKLDPVLLERKNKIISIMKEFEEKKSLLFGLEENIKENDEKLVALSGTWQQIMYSVLNENQKPPVDEEIMTGPLLQKLQQVVAKMEMMRRLIPILAASRSSHYDWNTDPDKRIPSLALARKSYSVVQYTEQ